MPTLERDPVEGNSEWSTDTGGKSTLEANRLGGMNARIRLQLFLAHSPDRLSDRSRGVLVPGQLSIEFEIRDLTFGSGRLFAVFAFRQ